MAFGPAKNSNILRQTKNRKTSNVYVTLTICDELAGICLRRVKYSHAYVTVCVTNTFKLKNSHFCFIFCYKILRCDIYVSMSVIIFCPNVFVTLFVTYSHAYVTLCDKYVLVKNKVQQCSKTCVFGQVVFK